MLLRRQNKLIKPLSPHNRPPLLLFMRGFPLEEDRSKFWRTMEEFKPSFSMLKDKIARVLRDARFKWRPSTSLQKTIIFFLSLYYYFDFLKNKLGSW